MSVFHDMSVKFLIIFAGCVVRINEDLVLLSDGFEVGLADGTKQKKMKKS